MPISCHFRDCKALLVTSLTRVSGAIASPDLYLYLLRQGGEVDVREELLMLLPAIRS